MNFNNNLGGTKFYRKKRDNVYFKNIKSLMNKAKMYCLSELFS